jgi:adenylate cyclase
MVAAAAVLVVAVGGLFWWQPWTPDVEPASVERMAFPLPDKPSIAVLAFDNLSGDPEKNYLSDGLSENIITELSRFKEFFVIARNSTFAYKGEPVKVRQVAEELGVRYVVEGSVQIAGDRVRVTSQLIDATSGKHLWAERYDRDLQDIFAVQDEITQTIVATLAEKVDLAERERATRQPVTSLQAYELHQRGREIWHRWTREANEEARKLYEQAIELDPKYPGAYRSLAWTHINDYRYSWSESPVNSLGIAFDTIQKAVALDPFSHRIRWTLAKVRSLRGEHDQALQEFDRALELNPNAADVIMERAELLVYTGRVDEALSDLRVAMRLNPHHPNWYHWSLGWVLYEAGQYEEALVALKKLNPFLNPARRSLAAVYVRLGRIEEAKAEAEEFLKKEPDYSLENEKTAPYKDPSQLERWTEDLRKAGFPE